MDLKFRCLAILVVSCLGLSGCVPVDADLGTHPGDPHSIRVERDVVIDRCGLTPKDLFLVDFMDWLRDNWEIRESCSCSEVRDSLEEWRNDTVDRFGWNFMSNPAIGGEIPPGQGLRMIYLLAGTLLEDSDDISWRSVVVDMSFGELRWVDDRWWAGLLQHWGEVVVLGSGQILELESATIDTLLGSQAGSGWLDDTSTPEGNDHWVALEGLVWSLTLCTDDYNLYRFYGYEVGPPEIVELIDHIWALTG